jgi:glycosyltransferase involved in cell wall biosynthesis
VRVGLHVGQLLQPVPGGIGRYVDGLMAALPGAGIDVVPFAAGPPPPSHRGRLPGYVDLGRPHAPLRYELWHRLRRPRLPFASEVLHAPSLAVPPAHGTPLVVTVHDLAFLRHPEVFTRRGVDFHRRGLAIAHREAAVVLAISEFTRGELIQCGFEADRVQVAPMAIVVPSPEIDSVIDARIAAAGVEGPYVVSVGTVEPRKGLDTLAAAVADLRRHRPDLSLVLAGPTGWLSVDGIDRTGVRRLGRVDEATLDALYRRALVCALPSRYEGFGLPVLEAMARGCPVVASDTTALPEVVADAGRLVPPGDVAAWRAALAELIDDEDAREDLAARGYRRAEDFTWDATARAHRAAYEAARIRAARS